MNRLVLNIKTESSGPRTSRPLFVFQILFAGIPSTINSLSLGTTSQFHIPCLFSESKIVIVSGDVTTGLPFFQATWFSFLNQILSLLPRYSPVPVIK